MEEYKKNIYGLNNINDNIYFIPNDANINIDGIKDKKSQGEFTAYICQNNTCSEAIKSFDSLHAILSS